MKIYDFILCFLILVVQSCDPADRRMMVQNASDTYIYYTYMGTDSLLPDQNVVQLYDLFTSENAEGTVETDTIYPNLVPPHDKQIVLFNSDWEGTINSFPNQTIKFFVFEKELIEQYEWAEIAKQQLYSAKYSYSVEELKARDWTITYPKEEQ